MRESRQDVDKLQILNVCGSSSVGRASAFQAECREFEPRLPLQTKLAEDLAIESRHYETFEKGSTLVQFKEGENFNHRNT